jgi:hypothetical protein
MPRHHFNKGKLQNQHPFIAAGAVFSKKPSQPRLLEAPPGTDVLKLHKGLRKAESSLAIQLRRGINGLDAFLFQARVPSVFSPPCSCGRGRQTAKHVFIFSPQYSRAQHEFRDELGHLPDS